MLRAGHYQKVRKPTGAEVKSDAARILEQLLEQRIDADLRGPHNPRRNKTDPDNDSIRVSIIETPGGQNVARSKTMPSKYREPKGQVDEREKALMEKIIRKGFGTKQNDGDEGSQSSADTDDDGSITTEKRRKKSIFKRAKERLVQTFNRDQSLNRGKDKEKDRQSLSSPSKKRKVKPKNKDKSNGVVNDSPRLSGHVNADKSVDYHEEYDETSRRGSTHAELRGHRGRTGPDGRKSFFSFVKPGKRSSKKDRHGGLKQETDDDVSLRGLGDHDRDNSFYSLRTNSPSPPRSTGASPEPPVPSHPSPTMPCSQGVKDSHSGPHPLQPGGSPQPHQPHPPPVQGKKDPPVRSKSSSPSVAGSRKHSLHPPTTLSSSSSALPLTDGSLRSGYPLRQGSSANILDSPGDDIEFMDADGVPSSNGDRKSSLGLPFQGMKFHGSQGLLNLSWLADRTAEHNKQMDLEIDETIVSREGPDGSVETTNSVTATVAMSDIEEDEGADGIEGAQSGLEKDEMYGKIAQKLIEMADAYSASMSDSEGRGAQAAPLSDLEKQIIACLRKAGDGYTRQLEEDIEEMKIQTKQEAYERFRSTLQNTMGSGPSWDQLAFVFYTTKGVVSTVGRGTRLASEAKEFTLRYISDTFASWIMDQGGFDSMLSSCESDYDLD